jgi:myo-inositol catabolism protein IolS
MTSSSRAPKKRAGRAERPTAPRPSIPEIPLPGSSKPHPALGVGLWGLGRWSPEDEARTKAMVGRAWERGLRWFDTAEVYGNGRSERILGEVLQRAAAGGTEAYVVTKVSWEHLRPSQVRAALINSLERLARRSVDLYLVHAPDPHVPIGETMRAIEALWKEGKTGAIGVSNFSTAELEEASKHLSETRIVVNQVQYNLFDREDGEEVRDYCRKHGILIEAYTPLARGLLAGRYLDRARVPADVRRYAQRLFDPERFSSLQERGRRLRDLAEKEGVLLASLALHWLEAQGAAPIVGMSRPEQVDENLRAWASRPSARVLAEADAIARGDRA